jgi:DinB superfamily
MKYTLKDGFPYYLEFVKNLDCLSPFTSKSTFTFLNSIGEEKALYRYELDKWCTKQIVGHITDHEKIMIFRAFLMSRNVKVELWGYDQNLLVNNSRFEELTFSEILTDYKNVRKATISFIESLSENQLNIKGWAGQNEIILKDFLKSIIGHEIHHINIIKERYI